ncbi:exonuclease SbcC [Marine Group I thaumarchaeote]|uniref:Exonuclease SbcC n=1 Tax=Marine Group I thaumarchaeote TaxID=2511932 RepID=A0A7K4MAM9_9ARCH|nr:MAG: exonuclease SbcC [Nitrosopumilus sp. YT1]NMI82571.1 exonuclease SbcC [Candidatus Nitrosopumilus sp. MTA1]NWJ20798.1 exonuclease SbcC [Marine Group I thaumarchaeote]NWJ29130.1 exonuclease SbcC [Marine Group I thaumarchaeote]NWJ57377.1 exonuclease SbcC [Marine Group I thaumarchaeote]
MVFGWGKKKQDEKFVVKTPQEKEVQLSNVHKIVAELNELRKSQTVSEIKHLRNNTGPLMDDLMQIGNVLDKDNLKVDDIDTHLSTIVIRGKKQVIDVIKKNVVYLPEISSIDDAKKLNSLLNQILKKLGDVLGRQTRVIHIFAKKYANQLKRNLEVMNNNNSEIHNLLKNYDFEQSASDEITNTLNQIKTLKDTHLEKNQKIDNTNKSIQLLDEKITLIHNSIGAFKLSENYKKYLDLKNTLDVFSTQKSKIKNEVDTQFTKISRPLSRYEYGSALDKEQKNLLTRLIKEPFEVLIPQNKDSIILILENVRKGISSGSISVKDIDKSLSYITETEETLDNFVTQILEYLEKHEKMKNDLNSLNPDELVSLEQELTKNTSFKEDLQLKSETFQGEINEIDSKIPQLVSEIEKKLRQFSNTKYTVLLH